MDYQDCSKKNTINVLMIPDYPSNNPYQGLLATSLISEGIKVEFPKGYRRIFPIFRAVRNQSPKIDILHIHWLNPYLKGKNWLIKLIYCAKFLLDLILVGSTGCKIVWTIHNSLPHEAKFPRLELWIRSLVAKLVDRIIIHQACSLEEIATLYQFKSTKAVVIPHGNYRQVYHPPIPKLDARKQLGFPLTGLIYLNFGLLRPYKGIDELLEVWEQNQNFLQQDTLVIAGKAGEESYGKKLKEKASRLQGIILHNHFIEDDSIHLYFSAADVVICPFRRILSSGSIILAMSYGKPIIAPRFNSIKETLGKADALLYDPKNKDGLFYAINQSKQQDIMALSKLVTEECDRLDWSRISQKTYQLYQNIVAET